MTSDPVSIAVDELQAEVSKFCEERDWRQFHSPKNLAMALAGEIGELVAIFQWRTEAESWVARHDLDVRPAIQDEMADVFIYLLRLAEMIELDLAVAVREKLAANRERYAVHAVRGNAQKQPHLDQD